MYYNNIELNDYIKYNNSIKNVVGKVEFFFYWEGRWVGE